jgi:2,3,4,5-tetrahydropyridine-2-carboxylate N-succinyltransferase
VTTQGAVAIGIATVVDTDGTTTVLDMVPDSRTFHGRRRHRLDRTDRRRRAVRLRPLVGADEARGVRTIAVKTVIADLSVAPVDAHDVYLRLHLLSHRLVQPHANLDGQFGLLANVVWTNSAPAPSTASSRRASACAPAAT